MSEFPIPEKSELACADCDELGHLHEAVELSASGSRPVTPRANPDGTIDLERGHVENEMDHEVERVEEIYCANCDTTFQTWEEATAVHVSEYRCDRCGWWGMQPWLHGGGPGTCSGELRKIKTPQPATGLLLA